jgi:hypothetical protein
MLPVREKLVSRNLNCTSTMTERTNASEMNHQVTYRLADIAVHVTVTQCRHRHHRRPRRHRYRRPRRLRRPMNTPGTRS